MTTSWELTVFESDCHLTLEFGPTGMTCNKARRHSFNSQGPRHPHRCQPVRVACVCVRFWNMFTAVHIQFLHDRQCQNVGLTNLWVVSLPSSTTQYSLIFITWCPKCFEHNTGKPRHRAICGNLSSLVVNRNTVKELIFTPPSARSHGVAISEFDCS
jgi:hypothetical protein